LLLSTENEGQKEKEKILFLCENLYDKKTYFTSCAWSAEPAGVAVLTAVAPEGMLGLPVWIMLLTSALALLSTLATPVADGTLSWETGVMEDVPVTCCFCGVSAEELTVRGVKPVDESPPVFSWSAEAESVACSCCSL